MAVVNDSISFKINNRAVRVKHYDIRGIEEEFNSI